MLFLLLLKAPALAFLPIIRKFVYTVLSIALNNVMETFY